MCLWVTSLSAAGLIDGPYPVYLVDNFDDGELAVNPEWWQFGDLDVDILVNNPKELKGLSKRALRLTGRTSRWYLGGIGTYFPMDARKFTHLKLLIKGVDPELGASMVIELYDDDNGNFQIEPHPIDGSMLKVDDRFVYNLKIDWLGWKVVIIPLEMFRDENPHFGDDIWNPYQEGGSGGLLQMQLLLMGLKENARVDIWLDAVKFFKKRPEPVKKLVDDGDFF